MGSPPHERGRVWGTGRFPTLSGRRGLAGETWLPPRTRAEGECCSWGLDPHRARRPRDDLHRLSDVTRVQVRHLRFRDRAQLRLREPAYLVAVRLTRARLEPERLLDQHGGRGSLGDERERAVLEHGDLDRDDPAVLVRGLRVVRLAELHDVDPVLSERGTDRRRRVGLPARNLELDERKDLLGHQSIFFTWSKPSST